MCCARRDKLLVVVGYGGNSSFQLGFEKRQLCPAPPSVLPVTATDDCRYAQAADR